MSVTIQSPPKGIIVDPEELSQDVFSAFGTVIENPAPSLMPAADLKRLPPKALLKNQGSALVYGGVSDMRNLYNLAPSKEPGKAVMSMFVSAPRSLLVCQESFLDGSFPVVILERHPFTSQTFIPLGLSPSDAKKARYLVIVAPTLPSSSEVEKLPAPDGKDLPGRGLPDITKIRAFICKGSQAVTYGAGTWHAPMVVVGTKLVNFVVVQFANGVAVEDYQEVLWKSVEGKGQGVTVVVPKAQHNPRLSNL